MGSALWKRIIAQTDFSVRLPLTRIDFVRAGGLASYVAWQVNHAIQRYCAAQSNLYKYAATARAARSVQLDELGPSPLEIRHVHTLRTCLDNIELGRLKNRSGLTGSTVETPILSPIELQTHVKI